MKPSIELFKLIKSLTKSEKRFFKLSSSLQSGDKNYIKIFNFIDAQLEYDEEELKKTFKNETFVKHLSSEKNHLYKLILKSLRSYYSEESPSSILIQEIKNIELLYNKALYKECEKFIARAKKIAIETELFYYLTEIITWEKRLKEEGLDDRFTQEELQQTIIEEEEVIKKLRNLAEYQIIYSKINTVFRSGGFIRSEQEEELVNEIANYHLISGKNTALSTRASSMCYYIKGLCAATNRNYTDSYQFFNRTRTILDNNLIVKQDLATRYVQTLTHLLRCYIDGRKFEEANKLIDDLRNLKGQKGFDTINVSIRIFSNAYFMELLLLQRKGAFQESIELINRINLFIDENHEEVSKEQTIFFLYYSAVSYFAIGDYKKSLLLINEVLNDNEQHLRKDIFSVARILNILVHFELGNYEFTEYVIKSVNRFLSKHGRDYASETLLIKAIRKLIKTTSFEKQEELLINFNNELNNLFKDHHEQAILEYFDLSAWFHSKINRVSFDRSVVTLLESK